MINNVINGIELLEVAVLLADGTIDSTSWTRIENIEEGSVSLATTAETKTNITPEDKSLPELILYTPGDPDVYNFAMLEISPANLQRFWNVLYDITTSKVTVLAKKKYAILAFRLTSRAENGQKAIMTFNRTQSVATYKNNIAKNGLLAIAVAASILPWVELTTGKDASHTIQFVNEDGSVIDSTPPTVTPPASSASSTATKALVATATANSPKTIVSQLWTLVSGPAGSSFSAPTSLTTNIVGMVTGVYVVKITVTDSEGLQASGTTTITATVA